MMDRLQPDLIWVKGHSRQKTADPVQSNFSFLDQKVRKQLRKEVVGIS